MYDIEKEKREAAAAGERALSSLRRAQAELSSAKNWGVADLFGGGLFTTMVKHSKIDNANACIEQAKCDLQKFRRELGDVEQIADMRIEIGDFLGFADYFFDGMVADWMVQDRINSARSQVDDAVRRVEGILAQLRGR